MAGIKCACGSVDWSVTRTIQGDDEIDRVRICKKCGRCMVTVELPGHLAEAVKSALRALRPSG